MRKHKSSPIAAIMSRKGFRSVHHIVAREDVQAVSHALHAGDRVRTAEKSITQISGGANDGLTIFLPVVKNPGKSVSRQVLVSSSLALERITATSYYRHFAPNMVNPFLLFGASASVFSR